MREKAGFWAARQFFWRNKAEQLKWRGFLVIRIGIIEMAKVFRVRMAKMLKWPKDFHLPIAKGKERLAVERVEGAQREDGGSWFGWFALFLRFRDFRVRICNGLREFFYF